MNNIVTGAPTRQDNSTAIDPSVTPVKALLSFTPVNAKPSPHSAKAKPSPASFKAKPSTPSLKMEPGSVGASKDVTGLTLSLNSSEVPRLAEPTVAPTEMETSKGKTIMKFLVSSIFVAGVTHRYAFTNSNTNVSGLRIHTVDSDDELEPDLKPLGMLDDEDWGLSKAAFGNKYMGKGAKLRLFDMMMHYDMHHEKGLPIATMREIMWDMIKLIQPYTDSSISTEADACSPSVSSVFDRFRVEFGEFARQIPRLVQTNAAAYRAAGVKARSKRIQSGKVLQSSYLIQWAGKDYSIEKWNDLLDLWEKKYPVITGNRPGADNQIAKKQEADNQIADKQEPLKNFRVDCWNLLRPVVWPATARVNTRSKIPDSFRAKFKLDIWGNVVTFNVSFSIT